MNYHFLFLLIFTSMSSYSIESISVSSTRELYKAIVNANSESKVKQIIIEPGIYELTHRIILKKDGISLTGRLGPQDTILRGQGMKKSRSPEILIDVMANNISITGITLTSSANHLIQVRAEKNASNFHLSNSILQDSYEQMLKVSGALSYSRDFSENGIIENCVFEYTENIGPQYYIGGIDAHRSKNWTVRNNTFRNIASPSKQIAEHAIHFWNDSYGTQVIGNTIINSDRGIGFGLGNSSRQHQGGLIENNVIIHTNTHHPFSDTGIALESSPDSIVRNNTVLLYTNYPNAIEYRFSVTKNVIIENNKVNKKIKRRDNATAVLSANEFVD